MISVEYEDYIKAFKLAGFSDIKFLKKGWAHTRGLFVAENYFP
jgi:hypothetical protein